MTAVAALPIAASTTANNQQNIKNITDGFSNNYGNEVRQATYQPPTMAISQSPNYQSPPKENNYRKKDPEKQDHFVDLSEGDLSFNPEKYTFYQNTSFEEAKETRDKSNSTQWPTVLCIVMSVVIWILLKRISDLEKALATIKSTS